MLMEAVGFSTTSTSAAFNIPSKIAPEKGKMYGEQLMLTNLVPAFYAGDYPVDCSGFDISVLLDCLIKHALTPHLGLLERSWIGVRNYLARFLLPALNCVRPAYVPPTSAECRLARVDYLSLAINNGVFYGTHGAIIRTFLERWGLDHVSAPVIEDFANPSDVKFVGRTAWYSPICGKKLDNPEEVPQRWAEFSAAIDSINVQLNSKLPGDQRRVKPAIQSVLTTVQQAETNVSSMCYYLDIAASKLSMTPIAYGMNQTLGTLLGSDPGGPFVRDDANLVSLPVPIFGELSAMLLVDWENAVTAIDPYSLYKAGALMNQSLVELCEANVFLADERFFNRQKWKKPMRFREMFKYVRNPSPILSLLQEEVGNAPYTKLFKWPADVGVSNWLTGIQHAFEFQEERADAAQCGYVRQFFYTPCIDSSSLQQSAAMDLIYKPGDYYLLDTNEVTVSYTYNDYDKLFEDIQNNALRARLDTAKRTGTAVAFKLPLRFGVKDIGMNAPDAGSPIDWSGGGFIISVKDLDFQFRWHEAYINEKSNDLALTMIPDWLLSQDGYEYGRTDGVLAAAMHEQIFLRDGFKLWDNYSWSRTF
jgi:hypothetical protein